MKDDSHEQELREQIAALEQRLIQQEQSGAPDPYRELFEHSADAILIIDDGRFVDCNQATVEMLRYRNKDELLQTHPSELSPEYQSDGRRSFEKADEMIAIAFDEGSHRFQWDHMRADGEVFPVEVLLTSVARGEKRILHVVWRDITERKRLESELRQSQKMEAIGKLSGGIAHDFNNLLVAILGHVELLELELSSTDSQMEHLKEIKRAGEQAADLVRQLLAFSRKQLLQPKVLDLNELVSELDRILSRLIGEDIQMRWRPHPGVLPVLADPGQLNQVVLNLASNARDAMPRGGTLFVETSLLDLDDPQDASDLDLPLGSYACLVVRDTGVGIPPEVLPRVFDPFYTTKPREEGTGLGLATVYGIVRQSHGAVRVESKPGEGCTVTIVLPLSREVPMSPSDSTGPADPELALQGNETVLLVEDEAAVGTLVEQILLRSGYTVYRAEDGHDALELVANKDLQFDLLLTDVVMPRIAGPALAEELRARRPKLKVLFASGYTDDALLRSGALEEGTELITKPFTPTKLLRRVRDLLDRDL